MADGWDGRMRWSTCTAVTMAAMMEHQGTAAMAAPTSVAAAALVVVMTLRPLTMRAIVARALLWIIGPWLWLSLRTLALHSGERLFSYGRTLVLWSKIVLTAAAGSHGCRVTVAAACERNHDCGPARERGRAHVERG